MSWPQANFLGITVFRLKFAQYLSGKINLSQKLKKKEVQISIQWFRGDFGKINFYVGVLQRRGGDSPIPACSSSWMNNYKTEKER